MATFSQLQIDLRDLIGDPDGQSNTWTPDQVKAAINAAALSYCEKTGVTYVEMVLNASADGLITLPDPTIEVRRVFVSRQGG